MTFFLRTMGDGLQSPSLACETIISRSAISFLVEYNAKWIALGLHNGPVCLQGLCMGPEYGEGGEVDPEFKPFSQSS